MSKNSNSNIKFKSSILWNSVDSITAQALVTIHHILLQTFAGTVLHGIFASLTSTIYTFIPMLNFGFDYALSVNLHDFTKTKNRFLRMIMRQFLPQFLLTIIIINMIFTPTTLTLFLNNSSLAPNTLCWLKITFIIEYLRKSIRSFLQLMLYSKVTALVEIIGTIIYMVIFWLSILILKIELTAQFSLKLLAFSACSQTLVLLIILTNIISSLSSKEHNTIKKHLTNTQTGMTKTRFSIWSNHIISQINYSNVIIPFSSACFGMGQASMLAILMNSVRCVTLFFQKGLGISSLAILSQAKQEAISKQASYSYTMHYLYNISAILLIFFMINASKLSSEFLSHYHITWQLALAVSCLSIIEGIVSVYEKFYITDNKIYLFSIINSIGSIILFWLTYQFLIFNTLMQFFLCFFFVRAITLFAIAGYSHYLFKLSTTPHFNSYIISGAIFFSVLFYLLF